MYNDNLQSLSFDADISPEDYISLMFERTDLDGIVYIPGWHYDRPGWASSVPGSTDENDSYRCRMNWSMRDRDGLLASFCKLYGDLERIAALLPEWNMPAEDVKKALSDDGLFEVWGKYLHPLDVPGMDKARINLIYDRMDTAAWIKQLAGNLANGLTLEEFEKSALIEYMDVTVSDEDQAYCQQYLSGIHQNAQSRVGGTLCACEVICYARRLCRLMQLKAPGIIIRNEARTLAAAMALNRFGISRDLVDNSIRLELERMELMDDAQLDELFRPKHTNSRKSLAPLFVYLILKEQTDARHHLRQQDILKKLEEYPYEIFVERKTLSRIVHNLADSQLHIKVDKTGVWYEK